MSTSLDPSFGFRDREIEKDLAVGPSSVLLQEFFTALSVCHTVLVEHEKGHYKFGRRKEKTKSFKVFTCNKGTMPSLLMKQRSLKLLPSLDGLLLSV